jgi:OmpA-OmpF porin, OOP family
MRKTESPTHTWKRQRSARSALWLLTLLPLYASCQPSVNASAEGPVQPQTPAPAASPTMPPPTGSEPVPVSTAEPASTTPPVNPAPTAPPVNPAPTTPPAASTTAGLPTTIPTTLPTTFPTAFPSTLPPAETSPPPATSARVRTEGDRILVPGNIVFDSGQTALKLSPENQTVLNQLLQFLSENPKVTQIRIEGYTDNVGKPDSNLKLAGERALAIKQWLVAQGVTAERVLAVGFGQDKPIADNATPAGRAQNRRTEFKIAAVNGRPYRGVPVLGGGTEFK